MKEVLCFIYDNENEKEDLRKDFTPHANDLF